jgi:hypothetical protein
MNLHQKLQAPFPVKCISWRVGATTPDKKKGIALAYIDARDCMKRLDDVVGMENWQCRYPFVGCCEIGINITGAKLNIMTPDERKGTLQHVTLTDEWIWKANGAGETHVEAEKGQYSDAFKRAAVMWGIGRYLYSLPNVWVPLDEYKRIIKPPELPSWSTPEGYEDYLRGQGAE